MAGACWTEGLARVDLTWRATTPGSLMPRLPLESLRTKVRYGVLLCKSRHGVHDLNVGHHGQEAKHDREKGFVGMRFRDAGG